MPNSEMRGLLAKLKKLDKVHKMDLVITITGSGHYRIARPDGRVGYLPCSPSGGRHSIDNAKSELKRRTGIQL